MLRLISGVAASIALFVVLGMGEKEVEYKDWDHTVRTKKVKCWKLQKKQILALLPLLIFGFLSCVASVPANHVGILYSPFGGTKEQTLDEGITIKSPIDKVYTISTETQTKKIEDLTTQTKDAQYVITQIRVKYAVNESNAFKVFKQYRTLENMSKSLITDTTQRVLEGITTKYNVIDILGEKRNDIYAELEKELATELALYGVDFDSVSIRDMDAGEELEKAIEAEAVAKKEAETAEQKRIKAEKDAETKLVKAKAEKEANELLEKSLSDKILQQQWIDKWNGKLPTYYGSEGNLMIGIDSAK